MALPASDTFTGSFGAALSANWTTDSGSVLLNGSNQATGQTGGHSFARWTGDVFPADHYAECNAYLAAFQASGPTVRADSTGGGQGYVLQSYDDGGGPAMYLQKFSGGGSTFTLISSLAAGASGDLLRIEASGSGLTAKNAGSTVGTATDSTFAAGGAGFNVYIAASVDNFSAGSLGGGGAVATVSQLMTMGAG